MNKQSLSAGQVAFFAVVVLFLGAALTAFAVGAGMLIMRGGLQALQSQNSAPEAAVYNWPGGLEQVAARGGNLLVMHQSSNPMESAPPTAPFVCVGLVESTEPWVVAGHEFTVTSDTAIAEGIEVGALVSVSGMIQEDGTWVAVEIKKVDNCGCGVPSLVISGAVVTVCAAFGLAVGVVAGYYGGWIDEVLMRVVDVLMAFPGILLNIAIVATVAQPGVGVLIFALALNGWVGYARVARGQVLSVREREYVAAARCLGASAPRIMVRHILPNILSPLLVQMTFAFGTVILVEASLSFLGLGPQVPYTWGALLDQGATFMWKSQRLAIIPGAAIMIVVLGANLLGDGLRDRLDPRRQR